MRILFMGTPEFAVTCLKELVDADFVDLVGVVTQPDRARGRGQRISYSPVKEFALHTGLKLYQPANVNELKFLSELQALNLEAIVVVAYGQLLRASLLNLTSIGCINVHASLLPKYRGASPIHRVIINGETKTGITTMYMDQGWDTGDMILKEEISITPEMTVGELHDILAQMGSRLLCESLRQIKAGIAPRVPQDHDQATYAKKILKEDGEICWQKSAVEINNQIRGMNPWPVAYTWYQGEIFKIYRAKVDSTVLGGQVGEIMFRDPTRGLLVQTGKGGLWLVEVQPANKRRMEIQAYLNGHQIKAGTFFGEAQ